MRSCLLILGMLAAAAAAHAGGPSSKQQAAAGAALFQSSGCTHCHGDHAQGGEIGPTLADVGKRLKPEELQKQLRNGGAAMPAFGDVLTNDEIEQLVQFLRTKRGSKAPAKADK